MVHLITTISRFTLLIIFAIYTYDCFAALKSSISNAEADRLYHRQSTLITLFVINANAVLFAHMEDVRVIIMAAAELLFCAVAMLIYKQLYKGASKAVVNNMCMLLCIGLVMLTRLKETLAVRQITVAAVALVITILIPYFIEKFALWDKLAWVYAFLGIALLGIVLVAGNTSYGAKINITLGPVTLQPSEFVKILLVFFIAAMLFNACDVKQILITGAVAAVHVLILAASRDLGNAMIFYVTFLVMVFVASHKPSYLLLGLGVMILAMVAGYFLFAHVRVRVNAWRNPLEYIDTDGYQVCQSLFAIGSGGWFGSGLFEGMPDKIPVVSTDFIFSAISEEFGALFALCLIFVCICNFIMFFNIAMQIKDSFYKLIALGLGTVYGFQTFVTLGGVTKFIPSTGVTLPLVSYGGSSVLSTMIIFAIIQGLYKRKELEGGRS